MLYVSFASALAGSIQTAGLCWPPHRKQQDQGNRRVSCSRVSGICSAGLSTMSCAHALRSSPWRLLTPMHGALTRGRP